MIANRRGQSGLPLRACGDGAIRRYPPTQIRVRVEVIAQVAGFVIL